MQKRLIVTLSASLGAALLVIAFLVGRMTGGTEPSAPTPPIVVEHPAAAIPPMPESSPVEQRSTFFSEPIVPLPVQPPATDVATGPAGAPASTIAYFAQMDTIRVSGAGDPTAFAQGLLNGIQNGDNSGIEALVNEARLALNRATAVRPPSDCAEYHRRLLDALSEATNEMEQVRDAIVKGDLGGVGSLTPQLQATQQKITELDRLKKQLLGQ